MKMAPGIFWGILLILIGLTVIIRVIFNIHFPIFRVLIAFVFILIGIKILFGSNFKGNNQQFYTNSNVKEADIVFNEGNYEGIEHDEYNVVFGKAEYNLAETANINQTRQVTYTVVFGSATIRLNPELPVKIKSETVFSNIKMPDNSSSAFGTSYYTSPKFDENGPYLLINIEAVFSGVEITR